MPVGGKKDNSPLILIFQSTGGMDDLALFGNLDIFDAGSRCMTDAHCGGCHLPGARERAR